MFNTMRDVPKTPKTHHEDLIWRCTISKNKKRVYVYPHPHFVDVGRGAYIHVSAKGDERGFKGYGGSTLFFTINPPSEELKEFAENHPKLVILKEEVNEEKGRVIHKIGLIGPWHTNGDALLNATGIDLTEEFLTFVVIAEERKHLSGGGNNIHENLKNILHQDSEFTLGKFSRGEIIAQEFANKLNKSVCVYIETQGGASSGTKDPSDKKEETTFSGEFSEEQGAAITA